MSNNNERIAQISALTINYEKLASDRSVTAYDTNKVVDALVSIANIITKENEIVLAALDDNKQANPTSAAD